MNGKHGGCEEEEEVGGGKVVVVAVKGSKEISKTALVWALTHVVQPGDSVKFLVLIPALSSSIFVLLSHFSSVHHFLSNYYYS